MQLAHVKRRKNRNREKILSGKVYSEPCVECCKIIHKYRDNDSKHLIITESINISTF